MARSPELAGDMGPPSILRPFRARPWSQEEMRLCRLRRPVHMKEHDLTFISCRQTCTHCCGTLSTIMHTQKNIGMSNLARGRTTASAHLVVSSHVLQALHIALKWGQLLLEVLLAASNGWHAI